VNASRALLFPAPAPADARAWEGAVDAALDRAATELAEAAG
jgi:hypothetical protein